MLQPIVKCKHSGRDWKSEGGEMVIKKTFRKVSAPRVFSGEEIQNEVIVRPGPFVDRPNLAMAFEGVIDVKAAVPNANVD